GHGRRAIDRKSFCRSYASTELGRRCAAKRATISMRPAASCVYKQNARSFPLHENLRGGTDAGVARQQRQRPASFIKQRKYSRPERGGQPVCGALFFRAQNLLRENRS